MYRMYSLFYSDMCAFVLLENSKLMPSAPSTQIRAAKPNSSHGKESKGVCKQANQQKGVTKISLL